MLLSELTKVHTVTMLGIFFTKITFSYSSSGRSETLRNGALVFLLGQRMVHYS